MTEIKNFFKETDNFFTIYVVEQRFVVGRGDEFFRSYMGKVNYIDSNKVIRTRISKILKGINKHIPNTASLVKSCFELTTPVGILEIISSLSKLFSVNEHQAVGPEVVDPIIIQEGEISPKYLNQIISLHKSSILRPVIIILLKDNDFIRARKMFAGCPHNTNIKMIRNSGECEIYRVINSGADNPEEFLEAFAGHCFSTCSNTKRRIIYNKDWADNSLVKLYGPTILQMRTEMLFKDKTTIRNDLNNLINDICNYEVTVSSDKILLQSYECIVKLFRLFCNDGGRDDIQSAYSIAKSLNNEILLAHVYRCAYFLEQFSFQERLQMMNEGYKIFSQNGMEDHAIYCKNNELVRHFDLDTVSVNDFQLLQEEAIYNVPSLVGMSHIHNNTGVAYLMNGYPEEAITCFDKGLDYACRPERCVQKAALLTNSLIAKSYCFNNIDEINIRKTLNFIFDNKELLNLPFLSARYSLNIVSVAFNKDISLGKEILNEYPIENLIQESLIDNKLGSGQLLTQLEVLKQKYSNINISDSIRKPENYLEVTGMRKKFLLKYGYNPALFSTWF